MSPSGSGARHDRRPVPHSAAHEPCFRAPATSAAIIPQLGAASHVNTSTLIAHLKADPQAAERASNAEAAAAALKTQTEDWIFVGGEALDRTQAG
jgi:hypothetical protein